MSSSTTATSDNLDPCSDGFIDGKETDTDCGGPDCKPCTLGRNCMFTSDCESGICRGKQCVGVTHLAAGNAHACAVLSNNELFCWGASSHGQIGDGKNVDSPSPVQVMIDSVVDVAAGGLPDDKDDSGHTCARRMDGSVQCWGKNDQGQLGDGTNSDAYAPSGMPVLMGAKGVFAGGGYSCAIKSDDSIACWGANAYGELGDGGTTPSSKPVAVPGLPAAITAIAAGTRHACAISGGGLYCWGNNTNFQLASANAVDAAKVLNVDGLSGVTSARAGYDFSCAFDGTAIQCWGDNTDLELSDVVMNPKISVPAKLTVSGVVGFSAGTDGDMDSGDFPIGGHACAVVALGKITCWGGNRRGQLGRGMVSEKDATPTEISGLTGAQEVVAGSQFNCARMMSGAVLCWGRNDHGQLGTGATSASQSSPVPVVWP
jgi:alpha-tubulin suppressor-like RCC1 family protein